jgi:hypothetical protein
MPSSQPHPELARADLDLRYEDLTQDGQLKIARLLNAVGSTGFAQLWVKHPLARTGGSGIMPILTRLLMTTEASPTMLGTRLQAEGRLELAHEANAAGEVQALLLNMFADVYGTLGRSFGAQPEGAGQRVLLGRAYAEHTFTKPFAPAGQRKVLAFDVPGQPAVPAQRCERRTAPHVLAEQAGDEFFDAAFLPDAAPWVFGMVHTDHNQHVNSLVYATRFEDAALRRLAEHGQDTRLQAASIELVYRKPCFAGQRLLCQLRAFRAGDQLGALGYVAPEGSPIDKAHCALRLQLRRAPSSR